MPNLGFQIEVLKQVIIERAQAGDTLAANLQQNKFNNPLMRFAVLGAMGPDILRYMPISSNLASFLSNLVPSATSGTALTAAQLAAATSAATTAIAGLSSTAGTPAQNALGFELYFNPVGAIYSVLFSTVVIPVWPILNHADDVLAQLDGIVKNPPSNVELAQMLSGLLDEINGLQKTQSQLAGLSSTIGVLQAIVGGILTQGPWMEMNQTFPAPADPVLDRRDEFLRWHHTGRFAQTLLQNATSKNQKAFAFGWLCHVASGVTAEPFVNNIVGGPYRTHWWRNRLASNFVDSWTFGFFEQSPLPTMSGDDPNPAYCDPQTGAGWASICNANLQDLFNVANLDGPASADGVPDAVTAMATGNLTTLLANFPFPAEISKLLNDSLNATYTTPLGSQVFPNATLPIVGVNVTAGAPTPIPAFAGDTFARAYIGAFAVYWFMTSGSGVVGNNPTGVPTGQPEPSWIQNNSTPSPQQAGLSVGGAVCAAILAILALFLFLTGDIVAGLAALAAALNAPIVDWSTVANDLFWVQKLVVDQENLLRDALVWSGLAYPPPVLLGMIDPDGHTLPVTDLTQGQNPPGTNVPATQGIPLCKTNGLAGTAAAAFVGRIASYPRWLDLTNTIAPAADLNFATYPLLIQVEAAATDNGMTGNLYPSVLIQSGQAVSNGGVMGGGGTWPTIDKNFGDAVANAVQIIAAEAKKMPDYNLDGDRGYGWQTWDPETGSNPFNPPVNAVKEA